MRYTIDNANKQGVKFYSNDTIQQPETFKLQQEKHNNKKKKKKRHPFENFGHARNCISSKKKTRVKTQNGVLKL